MSKRERKKVERLGQASIWVEGQLIFAPQICKPCQASNVPLLLSVIELFTSALIGKLVFLLLLIKWLKHKLASKK